MLVQREMIGHPAKLWRWYGFNPSFLGFVIISYQKCYVFAKPKELTADVVNVLAYTTARSDNIALWACVSSYQYLHFLPPIWRLTSFKKVLISPTAFLVACTSLSFRFFSLPRFTISILESISLLLHPVTKTL